MREGALREGFVCCEYGILNVIYSQTVSECRLCCIVVLGLKSEREARFESVHNIARACSRLPKERERESERKRGRERESEREGERDAPCTLPHAREKVYPWCNLCSVMWYVVAKPSIRSALKRWATSGTSLPRRNAGARCQMARIHQLRKSWSWWAHRASLYSDAGSSPAPPLVS